MIKDVASILKPVDSSLPMDVVDELLQERAELAEVLAIAQLEDGSDPILSQIREAHRRRLHAEQDIWNLLVYAREFMPSSSYCLWDLAEAAGLSIAEVRTLGRKGAVQLVAELLGHGPDIDGGEQNERG